MPSRVFSKPFIAAVGLAFLLVGLDRLGDGHPVRSLMLRGVRFTSLIPENKSINVDAHSLQEALALADVLERENVALRGQLKVATRTKAKPLLAKILDLERSGLHSTMLVDKGSRDGLKPQMPAIASGNILMGVVTEVFETTARVQLLDDPRTNIAVRVRATSTLGTLKGVGKIGEGVLDFITNQDILKEGDAIVTSGLDQLPEGLVIGGIKKIVAHGGNLFQSIEIGFNFHPITTPQVFILQ